LANKISFPAGPVAWPLAATGACRWRVSRGDPTRSAFFARGEEVKAAQVPGWSDGGLLTWLPSRPEVPE
jgi:hypothetical protein